MYSTIRTYVAPVTTATRDIGKVGTSVPFTLAVPWGLRFTHLFLVLFFFFFSKVISLLRLQSKS